MKASYVRFLIFISLGYDTFCFEQCGNTTCTDTACCSCFKNYNCSLGAPTEATTWFLPKPSENQPYSDQCPYVTTKCEDDAVAATLEILEKGEEEIRLTLNEDAVLLIGHSGHGKSTLAYFLGGNNTQLLSYKLGLSDYAIKDCHDKIGAGIISRTLIPDLVENTETGMAYYDNPGFGDTRCVCAEIANSYFMHMVASNQTRIKFGLVLNFVDITVSRDDFIKLLENTIKFVPNIEHYGRGISLVLTKAKEPDSSDEVIVEYVCSKLNETRECLAHNNCNTTHILDQRHTDKRVFIIESLMLNNCAKVAIFRAPDKCGFVSHIESLQQNRQHINRIINQETRFIEIEGDFGTTLSDGAREAVRNISYSINVGLQLNLVEAGAAIISQITNYCVDFTSCEEFILNMGRLYGNEDFKNNYTSEEWNELSSNKIISRLIDSTSSEGATTIPPDLVEILVKKASQLTFLENLVDNLNIDKQRWLDVWKEVQGHANRVLHNASGNLEVRAHDLLRLICDDTTETRFNNITASASIQQDLLLLQAYELEVHVATNWSAASLTVDYFLYNATAMFVKLGLSSSNEHVDELSQLSNHFTSFELFYPGLTKITEQTESYWLHAFKRLSNYVEKEIYWVTFLVDLFRDLRSPSVQTTTIVEHYEDWFHVNRPLSFSKLLTFWSTFHALEAIQSRSLSKVEEVVLSWERGVQLKFTYLDKLLTSLLRPVVCSQDSVFLKCEGNYVLLGKVFEEATPYTREIIVSAMHILFVERNIETRISRNITIIAPVIQSASERVLDFSGERGSDGLQPAAPGRPGGNGANVVIKTMDVEIGGLGLFVRSHGGDGGAGQPGTTGDPGYPGSGKNPREREDCAAWRGGDVRMDILPNKCCDGSEHVGASGRCHAGDNGCKHWVYGNAGTQGEPGGPGGRGGIGGHAGVITILGTNSTRYSNEVGVPGVNGTGGQGGQGGRYGETWVAEVDDVSQNGGKYCKFNNPRREVSHVFGRRGNNGTTGGNDVGIVQPQLNYYNFAAHQMHILAFQLAAETEANVNKYFYNHLTSYLNQKI